ncbi:MAG: hemerythrin family protein [Proteobacteria bacterium]|nr:hemerythrin family protein [Pseudomonadota bacterium]MBU1716067.1 hemerythrin family protein [Pseudomonadota bacterium]
MTWEKKYRLGILWQDFQHEQLINHIETMANAKEKGMEKIEFYETMHFLERYIKEHFALEAQYMKQHNYPKMLEHLKEHKIFIDDYRQFKSNCIYEDAKSPKELMMKLSKWVMKHIMKIDKELADFLIEKKTI